MLCAVAANIAEEIDILLPSEPPQSAALDASHVDPIENLQGLAAVSGHFRHEDQTARRAIAVQGGKDLVDRSDRDAATRSERDVTRGALQDRAPIRQTAGLSWRLMMSHMSSISPSDSHGCIGRLRTFDDNRSLTGKLPFATG